MSATNHTNNYNLPLFIGSDVPSWLVDWNNSMTDIDTALGNINSVATGAGAKADEVENNIGAVNTALTNLTNMVNNNIQSISVISNNNPYNIDFDNSVTLTSQQYSSYTPTSDGYMHVTFVPSSTNSNFVNPSYNVNGNHFTVSSSVSTGAQTLGKNIDYFFRVYKNGTVNINFNMLNASVNYAIFYPFKAQ